jgi:hypothetical protein
MRFSLSLGFLLAACSNTTDSSIPAAVGEWQLTLIEGQPIPAGIQAGVTGARLIILGGINDGISIGGALQWCQDQTEIGYELRWTSIDDTRVRITYPEFSGAAFPVDTATVSGEQLTIKSHLVAIGPSLQAWTTTRLSDAPPRFTC